MTTAVAPATTTSLQPAIDRGSSPRPYSTLLPLSSGPPSTSSTPARTSNNFGERSAASTDKTPSSDGKRSPNPSSARNGGSLPKIAVKKEPPNSPTPQGGSGSGSGSGTRHRPRRLDLSATTSSNNSSSLTARGPLTGRDGTKTMLDAGLACLSPGFQTHDPSILEQLQRSMSVREQQRSIIESRLQKSAKGDGPDELKASEPTSGSFGGLRMSGSSKKRPPPGLSIVPPSASQFANERVIQSAPLNQTFTGRREIQSMSRHPINRPTEFAASSSQHIQHTPANQTNNRLPPIADVFGSDTLAPRDRDQHHGVPFQASTQTPNMGGPLPSPGLPATAGGSHLRQQQQQQLLLQEGSRPPEYHSAEEAVQDLAGGREDLLPRIVHYGGGGGNNSGKQPATPPSPGSQHHFGASASSGAGPGLGGVNGTSSSTGSTLHHFGGGPGASGTSRRRSRHEYERDNGSPPLGSGPEPRYPRGGPVIGGFPPSATSLPYGPFGAGRDSPDTQRRKKEEFLGLCSRAWDLFHS